MDKNNNWNVDLKYFDIDIDKLFNIISDNVDEDILKESEVYIYDNEEYVNKLRELYPGDMALKEYNAWLACCCYTDNKYHIYVDILFILCQDSIPDDLIGRYNIDKDMKDYLLGFDQYHILNNIIILDTMIHEFRHAYVVKHYGYNHEKNSEDNVVEYTSNKVIEIIKDEIPNILYEDRKVTTREIINAYDYRIDQTFGFSE